MKVIFQTPSEKYEEKPWPEDETEDSNPGRVLDTSRVMERIFDLENDRILIKFQREMGQIFCKTVEFLAPRPSEDLGKAKLARDDVKVYMVDPREDKPCLKELECIYEQQLKFQERAVHRVETIEKEMNKLLEDRMKELSANDMDVWLFDTKRNLQVKRGRLEQEKAARLKEKSVVDLVSLLQKIFDVKLFYT